MLAMAGPSKAEVLEALLTPCAAISAIVLAVQMIIDYCKHLKYKRKIVLVTNGSGVVMDADSVDAIISKIREVGIELVVMLVFLCP